MVTINPLTAEAEARAKMAAKRSTPSTTARPWTHKLLNMFSWSSLLSTPSATQLIVGSGLQGLKYYSWDITKALVVESLPRFPRFIYNLHPTTKWLMVILPVTVGTSWFTAGSLGAGLCENKMVPAWACPTEISYADMAKDPIQIEYSLLSSVEVPVMDFGDAVSKLHDVHTIQPFVGGPSSEHMCNDQLLRLREHLSTFYEDLRTTTDRMQNALYPQPSEDSWLGFLTPSLSAAQEARIFSQVVRVLHNSSLATKLDPVYRHLPTLVQTILNDTKSLQIIASFLLEDTEDLDDCLVKGNIHQSGTGAKLKWWDPRSRTWASVLHGREEVAATIAREGRDQFNDWCIIATRKVRMFVRTHDDDTRKVAEILDSFSHALKIGPDHYGSPVQYVDMLKGWHAELGSISVEWALEFLDQQQRGRDSRASGI
ncbi:hypothetical protein LTR84_007954 [Exophiala bonariae]|uniref:Uncharacterized protein n=1 Tax=Exophiala bonariae TaxID=1690606 RepID=A0AAV9NNZ0_9EURO|nr:hypothetical protein LTR84_007954 [Exophiala bonariae]